MATIITKTEYKGTKLTNPLGNGIQAATVTAVNDLGMVKVNPQFPREDGKTEVDTVEFIFTGQNGGQAKKECAKSIHEKSFVSKLTVAATGNAPASGFDCDSLIGKNVTLITELKTSAKGTKYSKITAVAPAQLGQKTFSAPAVAPAAIAPASSNVGW
jgi:hypothetical protein